MLWLEKDLKLLHLYVTTYLTLESNTGINHINNLT